MSHTASVGYSKLIHVLYFVALLFNTQSCNKSNLRIAQHLQRFGDTSIVLSCV